jgi:hypothetical protein
MVKYDGAKAGAVPSSSAAAGETGMIVFQAISSPNLA